MSLRLPRVDRILEHPALTTSPALRSIKRRWVHEALAEARQRTLAGEATAPEAETIALAVAARLAEVMVPRPQALINATGVLLHTNLGRAPLSAEAVAAMTAAAGTCELEFEVESGRRGSRLVWLRPLLAALLEAEDVHVVGNGAAALLLACSALGQPGGVVLSRGQMVEIGDGFRVAEMATAGGTRLWEVGSTNRTHLADYKNGLEGRLEGQSGPASAILWVHQSNFSQAGFVRQPSLAELAQLGREHNVPVLADLGSGSLGGLPGTEPTIQKILNGKAGADLVMCSGDKLLGGPQAGILGGSEGLIARCRKHPLARELRPDKTIVAGLHATAMAYARGEAEALPLRRMISWSAQELRARAEALASSTSVKGQVRDSVATIGGGSLPGDVLASVALVVPTHEPHATAAALRRAGVVGRVHAGELLLDLRTVAPEQDAALAAAIEAALSPSML